MGKITQMEWDKAKAKKAETLPIRQRIINYLTELVSQNKKGFECETIKTITGKDSIAENHFNVLKSELPENLNFDAIRYETIMQKSKKDAGKEVARINKILVNCDELVSK